jgi:hypothetical protein
MRGAFGDFEAFGDLSRGEAAVGLEKHECGEEPVGFHLVSRFNENLLGIMTEGVIYGALVSLV